MAPIAAIEGIGKKTAKTLQSNGIRTCERLLEAGASKKGRKDLASNTGLSEKRVLEWVNRADLMRIKGVSTQYSDLLEAAGVDTVKELKTRRPDNLTAKMVEVNAKKKLVRRTPPESVVASWISDAKTLKAVVKH